MRRRRTREEIEQLEAQIYEALQEDHPQSLRHVFYLMTNPRLPEPVDKTEHGYKQVQARLAKMRRDGVVPYGWIVDATRRGYHVTTYADAGEFIAAYAEVYRAQLWEDAPVHVEVWTESRSIAGVVESDCEELAVSLYPAGGFASITLTYEAARNILQCAPGKDAHVLYIGDYDPAGVLIDRSIEVELANHGCARDDATHRHQRGADCPVRLANEAAQEHGAPSPRHRAHGGGRGDAGGPAAAHAARQDRVIPTSGRPCRRQGGRGIRA